jgi:hypothetical protein
VAWVLGRRFLAYGHHRPSPLARGYEPNARGRDGGVREELAEGARPMTQGEPPTKKFLSPKERERARARIFRPLAIEIGWLVYQWNRLQEAMAELFADIVSSGNQFKQVPRAIWYSEPSDRAQRELLRAAVKAAYEGQSPKPRAHSDIIWLLEEVHKLAGKRNVAFHSPLIFVNDTVADEIEILPMWFFGNPHAIQLKDKSLLDEFKWYKDHLSRLASFAEALHYAKLFPTHFSWPDRPALLPREQFQNRARLRRKKK